MIETTRSVSTSAAFEGTGLVPSIAFFLGFAVLYLSTAPENHSLSVDAYAFARDITSEQLVHLPPRHFLWFASMRGVYSAASALISEPDPFRVIGFASAVQTALAVTLFAHLLIRGFALDRRSAWLSAALLGSSYGVWRYATEIEVYATAMLLCVALLLAVVWVGPRTRPFQRTLALACLGGVATLFYQPIGLLAGLAIPIYLLLRLNFGFAALYCGIAGAIIAAGFSVAYQIGFNGPHADPLGFVLDVEHLPPLKVPDLMTPLKWVYAVGQDMLSINWSYAFEPAQELFARFVAQNLEAEIYAAERAGWIVWTFAITLPAAAVLVAAIAWTSGREHLLAKPSPLATLLLVWLAAHAVMMSALAPAGTEGWIVALVPMMALGGARLVAPTVAKGRSALVLALVAVFLLHNGLAGIGVLAREEGGYLRSRGEPLLERIAPGDLIIVAQDRRLEQFLLFMGATQTLRLIDVGVERARHEIDATLASGGKVFIVDDIGSASPPIHRQELEDLLGEYRGSGLERPRDGATGWFYELGPIDRGP